MVSSPRSPPIATLLSVQRQKARKVCKKFIILKPSRKSLPAPSFFWSTKSTSSGLFEIIASMACRLLPRAFRRSAVLLYDPMCSVTTVVRAARERLRGRP